MGLMGIQLTGSIIYTLVTRYILVVDTSVLAKSNMGQREYLFSQRPHMETSATAAYFLQAAAAT
jgi:hypothetical protein